MQTTTGDGTTVTIHKLPDGRWSVEASSPYTCIRPGSVIPAHHCPNAEAAKHCREIANTAGYRRANGIEQTAR